MTLKVGNRVQSISMGFTRGMVGTIEEVTYAPGECTAFVAFDGLGQQIAMPARLLREAPRVLH